jgi:lipopolysaccharide export system permease protein
MRILTRYVLKEHAGPLVFALSALTTLLLLNQVAKQFGNLVGKGLSWWVIGEFFALTLPFIVAMTLPMAVLVAVLYAFSRLSAENEVTALRASGVSMIGLVRPVLLAGILVAIANLLFNDQVLPRANHRLRSLQTDIARKKPTFALRAQVINEVMPGRLFLRAGRLEEASNGMREVTIFNFDDPTRRKSIYADSGTMGLTPDQRDLVLTLHNGYMQQIPQTNTGELQRLYFVTDLVRVRNVGNKFEETGKDAYKSEREMSVCEMDSMYQRALHEEAVARAELKETMYSFVHLASTGEAAPAVPVPPVRHAWTSGALYCRLVKRISPKVYATEGASETPPPPPVAALPAAPRTAPAPPPRNGAQRAPSKAGAPATVIVPPGPWGQPATPPKPPARVMPRPSTPVRAPNTLRRSPSSGGFVPPAGAIAQAPSDATPLTPITPAVRPQPRDDGATAFAQSLARLQIASARVSDAKTNGSRYAVEIQKKFALAAACAVFVIFGAPVGLRFPRGGVGMVLGITVLVVGIYYVGLVAGEAMADRLKLTPFWGMWMGNVLFSVTGAFFMVKVQRSGATARGGDWHETLEGIKTWIAARRPARRTAGGGPAAAAAP